MAHSTPQGILDDVAMVSNSVKMWTLWVVYTSSYLHRSWMFIQIQSVVTAISDNLANIQVFQLSGHYSASFRKKERWTKWIISIESVNIQSWLITMPDGCAAVEPETIEIGSAKVTILIALLNLHFITLNQSYYFYQSICLYRLVRSRNTFPTPATNTNRATFSGFSESSQLRQNVVVWNCSLWLQSCDSVKTLFAHYAPCDFLAKLKNLPTTECGLFFGCQVSGASFCRHGRKRFLEFALAAQVFLSTHFTHSLTHAVCHQIGSSWSRGALLRCRRLSEKAGALVFRRLFSCSWCPDWGGGTAHEAATQSKQQSDPLYGH